MAQIHSAGSPKISPGIGTRNRQFHMKRQKQVIRSTTDKIKTALYILDTNRDLHPPIIIEKENHLFAYYATLNQKMELYMLTTHKNFQSDQETATQKSLCCTTGRQMQY